MNLELTDEQTDALTRRCPVSSGTIAIPFSPRIRVLKEILAKIPPEPVREPLPPRRNYEPPSKKRYGGRGEHTEELLVEIGSGGAQVADDIGLSKSEPCVRRHLCRPSSEPN